jgi:hypothetical protein
MREERTLDEVSKEKGGAISADTLRRLYLLSLIGSFRRGVYGSKRLHKITYIAERKQSKLRPFEFKKHHYGQYSETLDEIKDQLITLGLVIAIPLDTSVRMTIKLPDNKTIDWLEGGVRYIISDPDAISFFIQAFKAISPDGMSSVHSAIRTFGYLPEQELIERCYALPEFNEVEFGGTIFESNLSDRLEVPNLSEDECEELEMALSPKFISAMRKIVEGMDNSKLDLERVKKVAIPV